MDLALWNHGVHLDTAEQRLDTVGQFNLSFLDQP